MSIQPEQLANEIMKALEEYAGVTEDAVGMGIIETAEMAVEELHNAKPAGAEHYGSWNAYLQDWTRTGLTKIKGRKGFQAIVHNKRHYQLAHLLENGHAIKRGGRQVGSARAFEHIAPIAERVEREFLSNVKKNIQ